MQGSVARRGDATAAAPSSSSIGHGREAVVACRRACVCWLAAGSAIVARRRRDGPRKKASRAAACRWAEARKDGTASALGDWGRWVFWVCQLKKEVSACNGSLVKSKKGGKQTRRLSLEHSHDPLTPTFPQCTCVRHLPPVLFLGRPLWAALVEVVRRCRHAPLGPARDCSR
jgi:hypothetical protein